MIYTTGTIAGNGSTITGTGTNFTAAGSLIRVGCTLIAFTNPVQVLQITALTSGNALSVTPAISPVIAAGTRFAILLSDSLSVDGLAQDIAETFGMYQKYMGGFADVMNGTGDVTITINGQAVTVPGQKSLAKKGANNDITSLGGLTTALSVGQGGTGGNTQAAARAGIGLGGAATKQVQDAAYLKKTGSVLCAGDFGLAYFTTPPANGEAAYNGFWKNALDRNRVGFSCAWTDSEVEGWQIARSTGAGATGDAHPAWRVIFPNAVSQWFKFYSTANTSVASDGSIKAASPVVKILGNGTSQTNEESEGVTVTRISTGEYLVEGCTGLNSDAAWGGIDGGFDIPKDRNRQALVWLDYEVNADGSVVIKTYHRTYPDAPEFAQNKLGHKNDDGSFTETVMNGAPVDIPADQFVSVRVEMPEGSIYNQKQRAAEKAMEETRRLAAEEAARKATEEAQADPDQP